MSDAAEVQLSENAYKRAVLAVKIVESVADRRDQRALADLQRKRAEDWLRSGSAQQRAFALHLLRFLYKKGEISIGWTLKWRLRRLLKTDSSKAVRLSAFDLLGAILTKTGSKSGV